MLDAYFLGMLPRAYLNKALRADWGLSLKEDEEVKQKTIDRQQELRRQQYEASERQKQMRCQTQDYMQTLSPEEVELIREEADSRLDEQIKTAAQKMGLTQQKSKMFHRMI